MAVKLAFYTCLKIRTVLSKYTKTWNSNHSGHTMAEFYKDYTLLKRHFYNKESQTMHIKYCIWTLGYLTRVLIV